MSYWNNSNGFPFQREHAYNPNIPNYIPPNANFGNASYSARGNYFETRHGYNNMTGNSSQQVTANPTMEATANNFYNHPDSINGVLNVSHSNLTPTAKEFTPSGNQSKGSSASMMAGGVRKKQYSKSKTRPTTAYKSQQNSEEPYEYAPNTVESGFNKNRLGWSQQTSGNYSRDDSPNRNIHSNVRYSERHRNASDYQKRYSYKNDYRKYQNKEWNGRTYYKRNNKYDDGSYRNAKDQKEHKEENRSVSWRRTNHEEDSSSKVKAMEKRSLQSADYLKRKLDTASQRERLEQMVSRRMLECLVCCERLRHTDKVWNCKQCYHILHLDCVTCWASSSKLENGWRCPACQNVCIEVPKEYRCYCGKILEPQLDPSNLPHSCGEVCGRKGRLCDHRCTLLCHPGPCPDCSIMVQKNCGCGKTQPTVKCGSHADIVCKNTCNKPLNCGVHRCALQCHPDDCNPCKEQLKQECFCGKVGRRTLCTQETANSTQYKCGEVCEKLLSCGNHKCQKLCHPGKCDPCSLSPESVKRCPCGKTTLSVARNSCLDPIPCCDKICNKRLTCGQPSNPHECKQKCHDGPCPPCPLTTSVRCRCGHMNKDIPCHSLTSKADDARCERKCTKKRLCGKHRCNQRCCIEIEHVCPLPCSRQLSCGLHRCPLTCHTGRCPPCHETSFEELYCECGSSVLYPPISCGTRPPPCNKPCSRSRDCGHDVNHTCHTGACPPCTVLCKRWCFGHHEQRAAIPCHQDDFSCGLPCGRQLLCGRHKCVQPCHNGDCPSVCTQPCTEERSTCGHICGLPCHDPPCPETPCKQMVRVTCQCGLRSSSRPCVDLAGEYQSIVMANLATKMAEMQKGFSVDISDIVSGQRKPGSLKTLECNDDCRLVERNRRLAIGLQIRNPDLSSKLTPRYSDYMKTWAKKDPRFCQHVHDKLTELVQLAKQSKQKSRSYSFDSMSRDKRHFLHEYCEHFGCDSAAYDQEPNRNVVATALRDKSWLPSLSLLELIQRENGQRRVPGPVLSKAVVGKSESVSLRLPGRIPRPATPPGEYTDYFNNPPE